VDATCHVGEFFDARGFPAKESPENWALLACCDGHPLHHGVKKKGSSNVVISLVSLREQHRNMKATLDRDQSVREEGICDARLQHLEARRVGEKDRQHERHMELLFAPLVGFEDIVPKELKLELEDEIHSLVRKNERKRAFTLKSMASLVRMGAVTLRPSHGTLDKEEGSAERKMTSMLLSSSQRVTLLNLFQLYGQRGSFSPTGGISAAERMHRSTWYRFLHHCSLLGPAGGVSFSQATAVFKMFAESTNGSATMLAFGNWCSALQHVLQGPNFYRTQKELIRALFDRYIPLCERRMGSVCGGESCPLSTTGGRRRSSSNGSSQDKLADEGRGVRLETSRTSSVSVAMSMVNSAAKRPDGWQYDTAEEQMCEPEVLQLLHEFEEPLQYIFMHYARRCREENVASQRITHTEFSRTDSVDSELWFPCTVPVSDYVKDVVPPVGGGLDDGLTDEFCDSISLPGSEAQASVEIAAAAASEAVSTHDGTENAEGCANAEVGPYSPVTASGVFSYASCSPSLGEAAARRISWEGSAGATHAVGQLPACIDGGDAAIDAEKQLKLIAKLPVHGGQPFAEDPVANTTTRVPVKLASAAEASEKAVERGGSCGEGGGAEGNASSSGAQPQKTETKTARMDAAGFRAMLRDFGFFPSICQTHSANQHIQLSLSRRGSEFFSYACFIECLCRLSFVYLSTYGNSVQQNAAAKRKCLWLITWLHAGFRKVIVADEGEERGEAESMEKLWHHRRSVALDEIPLEQVVLWRALDSCYYSATASG